jgi:3-oxoacyl-[acyl-carrier-protein] synthase-3
MSKFTFSERKISGIYTSVSINNRNVMDIGLESGMSSDEIKKFSIATGVNKLHNDENLTTSDYCVHAAKNLLQDLNWSTEDVDAIIFVTQTPDYILPKTSCIIQKKLNLREDIFALDINDGCSGFIYGMITAYNFCSEINKKVLLMMGETPSKMINKKDKSASLLFGDGGSCIAIEYDKNYEKKSFFTQGIDGTGSEAIIVRDGGFRNITNINSLIEKNIQEGITRNSLNLEMNGEDVFLFGITKVPKEIKKFINEFDLKPEIYDYFIMHQANLSMNNIISKKINVDPVKVLSSIAEFGNTSSLSIPITIVSNSTLLKNKEQVILCSGFGVGLSWGCALITLNENTVYKNLIYG